MVTKVLLVLCVVCYFAYSLWVVRDVKFTAQNMSVCAIVIP